jgi:uncharacterized protein (DUF362 family)
MQSENTLNHLKLRNGWVDWKIVFPDPIAAMIERSLALYNLPDEVIIKPNLNNDLCAFTGNSVDLRVIAALLQVLKDRGVKDIQIAEGFNVGMDRRSIDGMKRLRIDRLAKYFGAGVININQDMPMRVRLVGHSSALIARKVIETPFLINLCKVKTHVEMVMSCSLKNWIGIFLGQYKRYAHENLAENIVCINELVRPKIILVDGLIGMEGNGPGDGDPVRMDLMLAGDNAFLVDLVVAKMIGFQWQEIPCLAIAHRKGHIQDEDIAIVQQKIPTLRAFTRPPPRGRLAIASEARMLIWLKHLIRPFVTEGYLLMLAYRLGIVQDVYSLSDDKIHAAWISENAVREYRHCIKQICPMNWDFLCASAPRRNGKLALFESGECIQCLYCFWALPEGSVVLHGELGYLKRHVEKYKHRIERLFFNNITS